MASFYVCLCFVLCVLLILSNSNSKVDGNSKSVCGLLFYFDSMKWIEGNICHYIYLFVRIEWNDDRAKLKIFIKFDFKMYAVRGFSQKRLCRRCTEAIKSIASQTEAWLAWIEKPFNLRSMYYLQTNFDSSLLFCESNCIQCIQSSLKMVADCCRSHMHCLTFENSINFMRARWLSSLFMIKISFCWKPRFLNYYSVENTYYVHRISAIGIVWLWSGIRLICLIFQKPN